MNTQALKRILLIINLKTLIIALLAAASTALCQRLGVTADFPITLMATAVIFPIVFSINGAYKRREVALREYGSMKAHGRAIFFATRDWMESCDEEVLAKSRKLLGGVLIACRKLFVGPLTDMPVNEQGVYKAFSDLSQFIRHDLREKGLAGGEVSRCNQFLSKMLIAFEGVKHIYQYRTPRTLRAFSNFFIVVLPIVYGPYFAKIGKGYWYGLQFVMPLLFTTIIVSLANIQDHLENPFDQIGEDDVRINPEKFMESLAAQSNGE